MTSEGSLASDTWKSVKELLARAEDAVQKELNKAGPVVQRSLDSSVEAGTKGLNNAFKTLDSKTAKERADLLRTYRKFLAGQLEYVDARLKELEGKA
ncbi:MAG: DUF5320 domain-containing protein [Thaumarchaeota archaeon]|nr:DUF5320 domain-containing protein [Nitrososphaerota archaeon]